MRASEGIRYSVERGPNDVEQVVAAQRRHRRLRFWLGFAVIALIGGLWAGLTKDPLGPGLFGDDAVFDAPAVEVAEFEDFEVPTTVANLDDDLDTTTSGPEEAPAPETTGPPLTTTTVGP